MSMNSDAGIALRRYADHRAARNKPRREWGRRFAGICTGAGNGRSPVSTDGDLVEAPNSRINAQCVENRVSFVTAMRGVLQMNRLHSQELSSNLLPFSPEK
jgi:hypothetical protein